MKINRPFSLFTQHAAQRGGERGKPRSGVKRGRSKVLGCDWSDFGESHQLLAPSIRANPCRIEDQASFHKSQVSFETHFTEKAACIAVPRVTDPLYSPLLGLHLTIFTAGET